MGLQAHSKSHTAPKPTALKRLSFGKATRFKWGSTTTQAGANVGMNPSLYR